jgi:phosphatidylglycerophosphatase A
MFSKTSAALARRAAVAEMKSDGFADSPVQDQEKLQNQNGAKHWAALVATFFGIGYLKPGPGTWASLATVLIWFGAAHYLHPSPHVLLAILLVMIVFVIAIGVPAATIAERASGRHDPGFIVIDEVAGQGITLLFCPLDWRHALIALILFRLFDIVKPFPVRRLEQLPAGWGIVFDDVAAGLYALVVSSVVRIWF